MYFLDDQLLVFMKDFLADYSSHTRKLKMTISALKCIKLGFLSVQTRMSHSVTRAKLKEKMEFSA